MDDRRLYIIKFAILADAGMDTPSRERLDDMSLEDIKIEYQVIVARSRLENEKQWSDYIQIGKNLIEIMKNDPSLKEKLFDGVSEDVKQFVDYHL